MLIPLCFFKTGNNIVSSIDNRKLVEFPNFKEANWKKDFESYLADRIGGRSFFINLNTVFNDKVFRKMVHPTYTYGKDGYVFFKIHKNIEYEEFHHQFALMVHKIQKYCEERGIKFYFLFDPEKISVYSRYLPNGVYYNDDWLKNFFSVLDSLGVNYVNNSNFLKEKSYTEQVFNKKYDAGHWNDLGMFYGMNNLFKKMSYDFPSIRELTFEDFLISSKKMTSLPVSHFPIDEEVPVFATKTKFEDLTSNFSSEIPINSEYRYFKYLRNEDKRSVSLPRILLFQGSYLNRSLQFIINNASEAISVHNYQNVLDADYYIDLFSPDCVVFEVAEYVFSNGYFNFERMKSLDFSSSYESFIKKFNSINDISLQSETLTLVKKKGLSINSIFLEKNLSNVKNAYFVCDGIPFKLKNNDGTLSFSCIDANSSLTDGELIVENIDGLCYRYPVIIRNAVSTLDELHYVSGGVSFSEKKEIFLGEPVNVTSGAKIELEQYSFRTQLSENAFNSLVIQLYDPYLDTYKALCSSDVTKSIISGAYHHFLKSGKYILNVRANSNKSDEFISYNVYLEKGKNYVFDFKIDSISDKFLLARDFKFFETEEKTKISMETSVDLNFFDSVVVQLYDPYKKEYVAIERGKANICSKIYSHKRQTGDFIINFKCNSNKKDEMVSYTVYLENGRNYICDFYIDSFSRKKVVISGYDFLK